MSDKYDTLIDAMANMREEEAVEVASKILESGGDPLKVLENCRATTLKNSTQESTKEPKQHTDNDGQVDQIGLEGIEIEIHRSAQ